MTVHFPDFLAPRHSAIGTLLRPEKIIFFREKRSNTFLATLRIRNAGVGLTARFGRLNRTVRESTVRIGLARARCIRIAETVHYACIIVKKIALHTFW